MVFTHFNSNISDDIHIVSANIDAPDIRLPNPKIPSVVKVLVFITLTFYIIKSLSAAE